jgi:hypothetical protein
MKIFYTFVDVISISCLHTARTFDGLHKFTGYFTAENIAWLLFICYINAKDKLQAYTGNYLMISVLKLPTQGLFLGEHIPFSNTVFRDVTP